MISKKYKISVSILSADFSLLGEEIRALENAGADFIHIDVMDGHFVPNITFGSTFIKSIRSCTTLPFDVHLMINNPEFFIFEYIKSGADIITLHYGARNLKECFRKIKNLGVKVGLAISPAQFPVLNDSILKQLDMILIMTVNPGFPGQEFMFNQLVKIKSLFNIIQNSNRKIDLAVDGGINDKTASDCIEAGANILVAGSFIFKSKDYKNQINSLKLHKFL